MTAELGRALDRWADVTELSWMLADRCREVLAAESAVLGLLDGDELVLAATSGRGAGRANGRRVAADGSFAAATLRTGMTTRPAPDGWSDAAGVEPWSAAIVEPMVFAGQTVGCLAAFGDADGLRHADEGFGEFDARLLATLAATASVTLATVRMAGHDAVRHSVEATEHDRVEWAAELQDSTLQQLAGVGMLLTAARKTSDGSAVSSTLEQATGLVGDVIADLRGTVADIRPGAPRGLGVAAALHGLCARIEQRHDLIVDLDVDVTSDGAERDEFTAALHATTYRLVREALTNAAAHGKATRVRVHVIRRGEEIEIVVADNGVGLPAGLPRRLVLRRVRSAVELVGGRLKCFSPYGGGTVVQAVIPVDTPPRFATLARRMSADDVLGDEFASADGAAPPERSRRV